MKISKMTVGRKLYFSFTALIFLMIIISGISIYQLINITDNFAELIQVYQKIGDHAKDVNTTLLTARRHEKDFIARRDNKYVEQMDDTLKKLMGLSGDITTRAEKLNLDVAVTESQNILKTTDSYKTAFGKVAELILSQGDKDSGIQGHLRKQAHDMESAIKKTGHPEIMVSYLTMRRDEKDFIMREDRKYVNEIRKTVNNLGTVFTKTQTDQTLSDPIQSRCSGLFKHPGETVREHSLYKISVPGHGASGTRNRGRGQQAG